MSRSGWQAVAMNDIHPVNDIEASFIAGDDGSLHRVYDEHGSLIYTLCRRSLGADVASDVAQEVFAAAWFARGQFDPSRGTLPGWLVGIARNKILDHLRAKNRRPQLVQPSFSSNPSGGAAPLALPEVEQLSDRLLLADALAQLPGRPKRLIEMSFFEELSHAEIAERSDLPIGTVKSEIRRGIARMRRQMEGAA